MREREARESSSRRSRSIPPPVRAGSPEDRRVDRGAALVLVRALARVYPERAIRVRRCRRARAFVCAASADGPGPARTPRRSPLGRVRSRDREDRSSRGLKARRDGSRFATDRAGVANRLNGSIDRSDAATRWTFPAEFSHLARSRQTIDEKGGCCAGLRKARPVIVPRPLLPARAASMAGEQAVRWVGGQASGWVSGRASGRAGRWAVAWVEQEEILSRTSSKSLLNVVTI